LAQALGIDASAYGTSMLDGSGPMTLSPPAGPVDPSTIRSGPRVGVTGAHDMQWRFWLDGDPTVSTYRRHVPRRAG
jgi:DNA-3-methyladenine glycosylase